TASISSYPLSPSSFFFNDPPTTQIYTLSLHDALPICGCLPPKLPAAGDANCNLNFPRNRRRPPPKAPAGRPRSLAPEDDTEQRRSEEHTSELQSLAYLVCRLLLEKKKKIKKSKKYIKK